MAKNTNAIKLRTSATPRSATFRVGEGLEITEASEITILEYLTKRIDLSKEIRDSLVERYEIIDKEVAAFLVLNDDDQKREQDNARGKGTKPTDIILPLTMVQLDEAVTFMLSVMAPEEAIYTAQASEDKQDVAKGFAVLMNQHAEDFKHYRNLARGFFDMLKYNIGGFIPEWERVFGTMIKTNTSETGREVVKNELISQGNSIDAFDPYNTFLDPSVESPVDIAASGEFFATIAVHTDFKLKRMEANNEIYSLTRALTKYTPDSLKFYKERPIIRSGVKGSTKTNWVEFLSQGAHREVAAINEMLTFAIWINPKELGIDNAVDEYRIYRITTLGLSAIVEIQELDNAHGMLPINVGMPWDDGFGLQSKSCAELLLPMQRFSSYQINVHQRSARKKLYGLTIFDKLMIPGLADADQEGGRIPANPSSQDRDLRKGIFQLNDAPDTTNTLQDIEAMDNIAQKVLPTDMLKQVAGLERATQYQAAATVQGSNRRNLKMAKLINTQAMVPCRAMQMMNIFQYQENVEVFDKQGNMIEVEPLKFIDAKLKFVISDGLKGLDKLLIIESIKDVISWLLQNKEAAATYDMAAIIDYWTSMLGDYTDFTQFKHENEFDKMTPEQKQAAFELFQQALAQQQATAEGTQPLPGQAATGVQT